LPRPGETGNEELWKGTELVLQGEQVWRCGHGSVNMLNAAELYISRG
jgi:hypothetical protein